MITASGVPRHHYTTNLAAIVQKENLYAVQRAVRSPFRRTITLY